MVVGVTSGRRGRVGCGELEMKDAVEADSGDVCIVEEEIGDGGESSKGQRSDEEEESTEVGTLSRFGGENAVGFEDDILGRRMLEI